MFISLLICIHTYINPFLDFQSWNDALARSAKHWSSLCLWEHGQPDLSLYSLNSPLGQNLYISTSTQPSLQHVTSSLFLWWDEKRDYDFTGPCGSGGVCGTCTPGKPCGHYTQVGTGELQVRWPRSTLPPPPPPKSFLSPQEKILGGAERRFGVARENAVLLGHCSQDLYLAEPTDFPGDLLSILKKYPGSADVMKKY